MGKKIGVRQAVGVNSSTIRTIRIILMEKGLTSNKMAILVGGPDWPTSVLTGILGCSYKQMIIGSAPFIVTIPVTVLAGALQLKAKESPAMAAAAGTILMLASMQGVEGAAEGRPGNQVTTTGVGPGNTR